MILLSLFLALILDCAIVGGTDQAHDRENTAQTSEEATAPTTETTAAQDDQKAEAISDKKKKDTFNAANEDWGTYYDPQKIFCGKYDCYKILGFDYESFGAQKPDTKTITKRYRALSREWHPDKSKHKNAKERFVHIARAYEVLTNKELRDEYDFLRYNQEAYFMKYGTSVLWNYAPKSDLTIVLLVLFLLGNVASWYMQKHRWQMVADRLIKAAVEDWSPSQGGTAESKKIREEALVLLTEKDADSNTENNTVADTSSTKVAKKAQKKVKLSMKEKKQKEQEELIPIVTELVHKIDDFGAGFHKPTWKDLMVIGLIKLPYKLAIGAVWEANYYLRRVRGKELNDEERMVLTERAVGPVSWEIASEGDRESMVKRELWIKDNLMEWKEEQEIKMMSPSDQKQYMKLKKKGKLE